MTQNEHKNIKTAQDYIYAFATGKFPDGTELSNLINTNKKGEVMTDEVTKVKSSEPKTVTVSNKVKKFILEYLETHGGKARTVEIGAEALTRPDVVKKPIPKDQPIDSSRCTAWAGTPCVKLAEEGLIQQILVDNPNKGSGKGKGRSKLVYYQITEEGRLWLKNNK